MLLKTLVLLLLLLLLLLPSHRVVIDIDRRMGGVFGADVYLLLRRSRTNNGTDYPSLLSLLIMLLLLLLLMLRQVVYRDGG